MIMIVTTMMKILIKWSSHKHIDWFVRNKINFVVVHHFIVHFNYFILFLNMQ